MITLKCSEVPIIDREVGIKCYSTDFGGVGGAIKQRTSDFKVSEIIDPSFFDELSKVKDEKHKFPLYLLEKDDIDSLHAIAKIKERSGISLRVVGIKDAKAHTLQYATTDNLRNVQRQFRTNQICVTLKGFTTRPLCKRSLLGNKFSIVIRGSQPRETSEINRQITQVANFYGLQRFGSRRAVTHLVGKEIVNRNFRRAIELLLCYTTQYDSEMNKEIREKSRDSHNFPSLVKSIPQGMDIERRLMNAAIDGKDDVSALRSIPINIRRLFVQAYQGYIFNLCISGALLVGESILKGREGDLCFEVEGALKFGKVRRFDSSSDSERNTVPAIRLAGYAFHEGKGRFEMNTKSILKHECILAKNFYIKEMQELSTQGGYRQAPLCPNSFSLIGKSPTVVSFELPTGSYATTLLREIMKPIDPIESGF